VSATGAAAIDAVLVVVFVALGRSSHHEGSAIAGTLGVAAPFLLALAGGWLLGRVWQRPRSVRMGVVLWITTVSGGMVLRRLAWHRGTAFAFVIVATIVLGAFLVGWRVAVDRLGWFSRRDR